MTFFGKLKKYVGCITLLTDIATIEEIEGHNGDYIRITLTDDEGMSQSTWHKDNTPAVVFRLMDRLEMYGSHIRESDDMLVGPHLMRGNNERTILKVDREQREYILSVNKDIISDLCWLENILNITESTTR